MKNLLGLAIVSVLFVSCSSLKVVTDYDKSVDFSKYSSMEYYGWKDNSDSIMNRFDRERIENAFGDEFEKRGFNLSKKGEGDIIVGLHIVTEDKTQKTATTNSMGTMNRGYGRYYGYGPGYGWGNGYSTTTVQEYDYTVGTIVISVYDAKGEVLIWEAAGSGTIDENPDKRERTIPKAVQQIMLEYPVKPIDSK